MKRPFIASVLSVSLFLSIYLLCRLNVVAYAQTADFAQSNEISVLDTEAEETLPIELKEERTDSKIALELIKSNETVSMTLEDYLIMVVMSEVPYTYEAEALKAQAVASRTYTMKLLDDGTRHCGGKICNSAAHCSACLDKEGYIAKYGEDAYEKAYTCASEAVQSTDGEVLTYSGELCTAVYHAGSNGSTESSYNLWGTYTPYLVSVSTPEKDNTQTVKVKKESFEKYLSSYGAEKFSCYDIKTVKNDTGRCEKISVGGVSIKASELRSAFALKSCDFTVYFDGEYVVFTVLGYGHGIGLSQEGANVLAEEGKSYEEILLHYYTGVEIEKR